MLFGIPFGKYFPFVPALASKALGIPGPVDMVADFVQQ